MSKSWRVLLLPALVFIAAVLWMETFRPAEWSELSRVSAEPLTEGARVALMLAASLVTLATTALAFGCLLWYRKSQGTRKEPKRAVPVVYEDAVLAAMRAAIEVVEESRHAWRS